LGEKEFFSSDTEKCHGTSREMFCMASEMLMSSEDGPSQGTDLENDKSINVRALCPCLGGWHILPYSPKSSGSGWEIHPKLGF